MLAGRKVISDRKGIQSLPNPVFRSIAVPCSDPKKAASRRASGVKIAQA